MPEVNQQPVTRILRLPDLRQRTGLGTTAIYERLNERSRYFDPTFPKPISLGGTERARATGWIEAEVEQWLRMQIERRTQRDASRAPAQVAA
jgi:prophage regulatory protein